jgi:hypothetical protein
MGCTHDRSRGDVEALALRARGGAGPCSRERHGHTCSYRGWHVGRRLPQRSPGVG